MVWWEDWLSQTKLINKFSVSDKILALDFYSVPHPVGTVPASSVRGKPQAFQKHCGTAAPPEEESPERSARRPTFFQERSRGSERQAGLSMLSRGDDFELLFCLLKPSPRDSMPRFHVKRELSQNISINEVYDAACSLLVTIKNSCSRLHCQKGSNLIPFSCKIPQVR